MTSALVAPFLPAEEPELYGWYLPDRLPAVLSGFAAENLELGDLVFLDEDGLLRACRDGSCQKCCGAAMHKAGPADAVTVRTTNL